MTTSRPVPKSERLFFYEMSPSDARHFYLLNADPEVVKYTGDPPFQSEKDARSFLENYGEYAESGFGRWAVKAIEEERFIGWCGLKRHKNGEVDLGFRLLKQEWNKGYATEASLACLKLAFETHRLSYVIGRAMQENKASLRVLEKIGMRFWKETDEDPHCALCFRIDNPSLSS
ncbi:MAG: GNAT family N-acetyltransferase [Flavobacteriales bacterium]|nr:GNAT family N-acetyltransferase [Flavobacteriales bacterium]